MLKTLKHSDNGFERDLAELLERTTSTDPEVEARVQEIIRQVRAEGDRALVEFTCSLDRRNIDSIDQAQLSAGDIDKLFASVDASVIDALEAARDRVTRFHEKESLETWSYQDEDGTVLGQRITPLERVGIYVPGGTAAYPSSVLMTAIPARVAGVSEIIMTVPMPGGDINPVVIAAAKISGVDRIFTVGGAQAIAALAYGTESIPRVDKIAGPGNIWVATAKKQVFGDVGIDMIAGPSEVVVIFDDSADPEWVAMDMMAQAEHDEIAQSIAITDSPERLEEVAAALEKLAGTLEREQIIRSSLSSHGALILVDSLEQGAEVSNRIAPEHLELMVQDPQSLSELTSNAGSIFVGRYSAEVLGDYCAGPNHVLPTAGTARFSSPLGVYDFQKRSSILQASEQGADEMARIAAVLAECEGLTAHQGSATLRIRRGGES